MREWLSARADSGLTQWIHRAVTARSGTSDAHATSRAHYQPLHASPLKGRQTKATLLAACIVLCFTVLSITFLVQSSDYAIALTHRTSVSDNVSASPAGNLTLPHDDTDTSSDSAPATPARVDSVGQCMTYNLTLANPYCADHSDICGELTQHHALYEQRLAQPTLADNERRHCTSVGIYLEPTIIQWWPWIEQLNMTQCHSPVPCQITGNEATSDLSLKLRSLPLLPSASPVKRGVIITESFRQANVPGFDPNIITQADILITYDRRSDVPINYWYGLVGDRSEDEDRCDLANGTFCMPRLPLPTFESLNTTAAYSAVFISNCVGGRKEYIEELMRFIPIDSYGGCLHTPGLPSGQSLSKADVSKKYLFTLAFENWPLQDYVTEKLYAALQWGNVPVYWGAPNVKDVVPDPNAVINVMDFPSPRALAEHLIYLRANQSAYELHRDWMRRHSLPLAFRAAKLFNLAARRNSFVCRACESFVHKYCQRNDTSARTG